MIKTQYEKIDNLLQLEKKFTKVLGMLQNHKHNMTLSAIELGQNTPYYKYWLDEDIIDLLCNYYKGRLDDVHNELKEIGYYD